PAVVKRGALQIAISTGGASPALAKILREELDQRLGPEYARLLTILAQTRELLREREPDSHRRARLARVLATELRAAITRGDDPGLDNVLMRHLGVTIASLGLEPPLLDPLRQQTASVPGVK
ncbi:MAG: precorrin-2 dehydrogenase/sirohydrochlorin ferrochelatase family protein, partial [Candidatus Binataceae bacterium]